MNVVKFFPFIEQDVFKARCIACISAMNTKLNFGSDADFVRFLMVVAASTPISILEPSV